MTESHMTIDEEIAALPKSVKWSRESAKARLKLVRRQLQWEVDTCHACGGSGIWAWSTFGGKDPEPCSECADSRKVLDATA